MATGQSGRLAYVNFVDNYFKEVNLKYKEFEYANGQRDLPTQDLQAGIILDRVQVVIVFDPTGKEDLLRKS